MQFSSWKLLRDSSWSRTEVSPHPLRLSLNWANRRRKYLRVTVGCFRKHTPPRRRDRRARCDNQCGRRGRRPLASGIARRHLILVGGKGSEDLGLLRLRNLEGI